MAIARRGSGARAALSALASQVHPVFMLPPLASSWLGAVLAGTTTTVSIGLGAVHMSAAFFALYTAHVTDGYVDFYIREEDDDHPLSVAGCTAALVGGSVGFFLCLVAIGLLVNVWAALLTLPGWLIAINHAPQLDTNPVGATGGYPLGIGFALVGGFYVQTVALTPLVLSLAGVFVAILSGIKMIDDAKDYEYDRAIGKRTVAVALGRRRARMTAYAFMTLGLVAVVGLALTLPAIPPSAGLAAVVFGVVAVLARHRRPQLATKLLIRGSYVFLAVLVATVWFRPFA